MEKTKYPGVYRRGSRWVAVVSYRADDGTRKQKWFTGARRSDVEDERDDFRDQLRRGVRPHGGKLTLGEYLTDTWLPEVKEAKRPTTYERYESLVRLHIVPRLGGKHLADLDRRTLKAFFRSLPTASTARNAFDVLSSALTYAVQDEALLAFNPLSGLATPKYERDEARHLDKPEALRMLDAARGTALEGAIVLGLVGGLRVGEVAALRWADVDFETGQVRVARSYWGEPKTKAGRREPILPAAALEALRRFKVWQAERLLRIGVRQDDETPVVVNPWGKGMSPTGIGNGFRKFCVQHDFAASFHTLRHTAAILMLGAGVDVRTVAGRLGHSKPGFTLNTYAHYVPSADAEAARKLDAALGAPTSS